MIFFEALASGGGSDWYYTVLMKAPVGAEITLDDGDEEVTATGAGTDTLIGIPVHNPSSAYTLTVKMNGLTSPSQTVNTPANSGAISDVITVNFANIHIVYDDNFRGQALSITDGTHTASPAPQIPSTGNVMDIYVPYTGDWTLEATDPVSGDPFNSSPNPVPITSLTQSINVGLYVIPDGETVTPTDDIETWLLCADIKDTGYTTLEEVLNDEEVLIKVLTDENATQYLKRSTTWADDVTANELAMQAIGSYDVASEILLSDSDWAEAIVNSEYFEKVLNVKAPNMTGPSAPSGYKVTASSEYNATYAGWKAFDGDRSTYWCSANNPSIPCTLEYEFPSDVVK